MAEGPGCRTYDSIEVKDSERRVEPKDIDAFNSTIVKRAVWKALYNRYGLEAASEAIDRFVQEFRIMIRDVFLTDDSLKLPKTIPLAACVNKWWDFAVVTCRDVGGKDFVHLVACNVNELLCARFRVPSPTHLLLVKAFELAAFRLELDYPWGSQLKEYAQLVDEYADGLESLADAILNAGVGSVSAGMRRCLELGLCDYSDIGLLWRLGRPLDSMFGAENAKKLEEKVRATLEKHFRGEKEADVKDEASGRWQTVRVATFLVPRDKSGSLMPEGRYLSGKLLFLRLKPGKGDLLHRLDGYHGSLDIRHDGLFKVYDNLLKEVPEVPIKAVTEDLHSLLGMKDLSEDTGIRLIETIAKAIADSYKKRGTGEAQGLILSSLSEEWKDYAYAVAIIDPMFRRPPWVDPECAVVVIKVRAKLEEGAKWRGPKVVKEVPMWAMTLRHLKKHKRFLAELPCERCMRSTLEVLNDTRPSWEGKVSEKTEQMIKTLIKHFLREEEERREGAAVGH